MLKIVEISKSTDKGVRNVGATFQDKSGLIPLRVNEDDRPETYSAVVRLLETPGLDIVETAEELYELMSPAAMVKREISSSYYLSDNLKFEDGAIYFGDKRLEETLSNHMLSLLDDKDVPKDEGMWKAFVRFLDNLYQNVSEDVQKQLFKWMDYENRAGNDFGLTDDGCIIGYKGCDGTVLEPMSVFSGRAIVDGIEVEGVIPNRVGSVISMPRSEVQHDPGVGCSVGLHVGTRDYATAWAEILILVKVNPRDIVSVPYEIDSQKMRVCEYEVLKVTSPEDEHKRYFSDTVKNDVKIDDEYTNEDDYVLSLETAHEILNKNVYVEYDNGNKTFEGTVVNVFEDGVPGLVIKDENKDYKHIKLYRINYYTVKSVSLNFLDIKDVLKETIDNNGDVVYIEEGKDVIVKRGNDRLLYKTDYTPDLEVVNVVTGEVLNETYYDGGGSSALSDYDGIYKLKDGSDDLASFEVYSGEKYLTMVLIKERGNEPSNLKEELFNLIGELINIKYENNEKEFEGTIVDTFDDGFNPGVIMKDDNGQYKHIKVSRVDLFNQMDTEDIDNNYKSEKQVSNDPYSNLLDIEVGTILLVVYKDLFEVKTIVGSMYEVDLESRDLYILISETEGVSIELDNILSVESV